MRMKNLNDNNNVETNPLNTVLDLLQEGLINIGVAYIQDPTTEYLTHKYIVINSGGQQVTSMPEALDTPFQLVKPEGVTIN